MDDRPRKPIARAPLPDAWWRLPLRTRQLVAAGITVVMLAMGAALLTATTGDGGPDEPHPEDFVAALPEARVAMWNELAECESEGRWNLDSGNGYFGGLQFTRQSWEEVGGSGSPALASREEQIMRAEMLFELQGWDAWPRCSAQLGPT